MSRNVKLVLVAILTLVLGVQILADVWVDEITAKKGEDLKSFLSLTQKYQDDNWLKVNSKIQKTLEAESGKVGGGARVQDVLSASGEKVATGYNQEGASID